MLPTLDAEVEDYGLVLDYLAVADEPAPADAIICFGSRDPAVPAYAAQLYLAGLAELVVTTGGVPLRDGRAEAEVFAEELERYGVPSRRIIVERDSMHTGDNVALGMSMLRRHRGDVSSVLAVVWPFVARRCAATFHKHHPELRVMSVPSFDRPGERTPLTRSTGRWAVEQLDRLRRYSDAGTIAATVVPDEVVVAGERLRGALAALDRQMAVTGD